MIRSSPALVTWATLLLLAVATQHHGIDHIARLWPEPEAARRALFYIGQGLKGCLLWLTIALLLPRRRAAMPLLAVCVWGFLEDALVAGCRMAYGIGNLPSPGLWRGVCEDVTDAPIYIVGLAVGLLAACACEQGAKKQ